jgi:hypothetical protein
MRDALLGERSSGPRQRHGNGTERDTAGKRQCDCKLGKRQFHHGRLHVFFSMVLACPAQLALTPLYCNAQFFDRRVRAVPLKCREISKMKAVSASPWNRCVAISAPLTGADRGVESAEYLGAEPDFFVAYARQVAEPTALDAMMRAPPLSGRRHAGRCDAQRAHQHALPPACGRW